MTATTTRSDGGVDFKLDLDNDRLLPGRTATGRVELRFKDSTEVRGIVASLIATEMWQTTETFAAPADPDTVSAEMIFGVADCRAAYQALVGRGAEFLTPPVEYDWEIRAFFRDPDGHLFEISEARNRSS